MSNDSKTYEGSCHCGAVSFEVTGKFKQGMACNCSLCSRAGWILVFVGEDQFQLRSGENATTQYQFGKKHIHHLFCTTCGVRSYSHGEAPNGSTMYSVNARCLKDFDLKNLPVDDYDGAAI